MAPRFRPGGRQGRFAKGVASGADAVILALEDAVAPDSKKTARRIVAAHGLAGIPVVVRVNAAGTAWFAADIAALAHAAISAIMLPKAETAAEIAAVHEGLGQNLPVVPLIEIGRAHV